MALSAIPLNHPRRPLALGAARKCLQTGVEIKQGHKSSNNDYAWVVYCHWMLLHSPVTPFMSIFGHVIANPLSSAGDLELLEDFVHSLQPGLQLSEEIEKFHHLCTIFVQVAQAYVRAKTGVAGETDTLPSSAVTGEVDESLATLGFPIPQTALSSTQEADASDPTLQYDLPTPSFMDWYSGPMSLNELLEQDFLEHGFQGLDYASFG